MLTSPMLTSPMITMPTHHLSNSRPQHQRVVILGLSQCPDVNQIFISAPCHPTCTNIRCSCYCAAATNSPLVKTWLWRCINTQQHTAAECGQHPAARDWLPTSHLQLLPLNAAQWHRAVDQST
mmetsp:Transcript_25352/g.55074  ORF Transcript_25352/g.55074 Transcript_25352/m.55074 type:complete len:123 (-) Transcript_25352:3130-3498(-)